MENTKDSVLRGVRGWLLLLILVLTVFGPIWRAFRNFQRWEELTQSTGDYAASAEFNVLQSISWGTYLAGTSIGIAVGIMLWKRHQPSTVRIAILGFWLMGPIAELIGYFVGLSAVGEGPVISDLRFLIAPTASAAVWTAYLAKSKRVRNTYGA